MLPKRGRMRATTRMRAALSALETKNHHIPVTTFLLINDSHEGRMRATTRMRAEHDAPRAVRNSSSRGRLAPAQC